MILDKRAGIGPHHLSIGKTRKVFADGKKVDAFYSIGDAIVHWSDGQSRELPLPVAWGGVSFTVDDGRIAFVHRDGDKLCISDDLTTWSVILETPGQLSAPWLDGDRWTVQERYGGFHTADGQLDPGWHHSCVQYVGGQLVGFRGHPTGSHLVSLHADICPCNVNDRTTFHFGAVDSFIAYLDDGLTVSGAGYVNGKWTIGRNIIPIPCFAPSASMIDGWLNVFACDYHGTVWRWREDHPLERVPIEGPNISPLFGMTGYGTGGMLVAPYADVDCVPFLVSHIEDDRNGTARLELHIVDLRTTNQSMATNPASILSAYKRIV